MSSQINSTDAPTDRPLSTDPYADPGDENDATHDDDRITKFYVAYHDPQVLATTVVPSGATKVDLNLLPLTGDNANPAFAESRLILAMAINPRQWIPERGYVAMFHASYDNKFGLLPKLATLVDEYTEHLSPERVICPIVCARYVTQCDNCHPGMGASLKRVLDGVYLPGPTGRPGPVTNSLIAHTSVWRRFLPDWLRMYVVARDQLDTVCYDTRMCKQGLEPAYLMERFTTAWFAAQEDLRCTTMIGADGSYYKTLNEDEVQRFTEDRMRVAEVTVNDAR